MRPDIRFTRNDDRAITQIRIQADDPNATKIDRRVFGNFLEHLGRCIYGGVWGQLLRNPSFEPMVTDERGRLTLQPIEGIPAPWVRFGSLRQAETNDDAINDERSMMMEGASEEEGGVYQRIRLPVHRTNGYVGSVWLKTESGSQSPGVEASFCAAPSSEEDGDLGETLASERLAGLSDEWQRFEFRLELPAGSVPSKTEVAFVLSINGSGIVKADFCELFPAGHIEGMDPEIVQLSHEWNIPLLRYPGGNFVSGYHWKDGIGPREKRPTRPNLAWSGIEYNQFGTDEFMRFCELIGAEPHICVNIGNDTPESAADWVEYCNGGPETEYGALRGANGHPEPYNVRVWEVGNEIYGPWQIGQCDAEENARRYLAWIEPMRQRDPSIELIANGSTFEDASNIYGHSWNKTLLRNAGRAVESISLHPLVVFPDHMPDDMEFETVWRGIMAHPWFFSETYLRGTQNGIERILGVEASVTASVTEWGLIIGGGLRGRNPYEFPHAENLAGAVYAGLFLNAMFRAGTFVPIANITALLHGGGLKNRYLIPTRDPQYWAQKLYTDAAGSKVVSTHIDGPGYSHEAEIPGLPPMSDVPWLDAVATRDPNGKITLFVVNRHRTEALNAKIVMDGAETLTNSPRSIYVTTLAHEDTLARNTVDSPNTVNPQVTEITTSSSTLNHAFPAHSITVLEYS